MSSCANQEIVELLTSPIYLALSYLQQMTSLGTLVLTGPAIYLLLRKSPFHYSTKILLFLSIFFANSFSLVLFSIQTTASYRAYKYGAEPCSLLFDTEECHFQVFFLVFSSYGLLTTPIAMSLERLLSTIAPKFYEQNGAWPSTFLTTFTNRPETSGALPMSQNRKSAGSHPGVLYVWLLTHFVMSPRVPVEFVASCAVPPTPMMKTLNFIATIKTVAMILCIFINIMILMYNRRTEKDIQFDLKTQFRQREALLTSQVTCTISIVLFFGFGIHTMTQLFVSFNPDLFSLTAANYTIKGFYTLPYAAMATPGLLLYGLRYIKRKRRRMIKELTEAQETMRSRMKDLSILWDSTYEQKYSQP
ncbi:unnamed protein product [Caenorhabditis auriculariae]|uniref:Uncharacterized protein n=1 Tax=Caenorhabditis auriculariae TaxID=2777116 RepID=A0A8S1H671_9PELO|nr:unnamed protein product [Caenorhabditis auriculariae]